LFNLYALDKARGVWRFKLDRPSQTRLSQILEGQLAELLDGARERHPYAPGFRPSDGGVVALPFSLPPPLAALAPHAPSSLPVWTAAEAERARPKALVAVDGEAARFAFQVLEERKLLSPNRPAILFNEHTSMLSEVRGILLGPRLDAAHVAGTLHFTSESVARRVLDLDGVFRAATDVEISELFSLPAFTGFDEGVLAPSLCDTWVRRRVMSVRLSGVCSSNDVDALVRAASVCKYALAVSGGSIVVPREKKALKDLLKFLSEDYLDSPLRPGHVFEVASKRPRSAGA